MTHKVLKPCKSKMAVIYVRNHEKKYAHGYFKILSCSTYSPLCPFLSCWIKNSSFFNIIFVNIWSFFFYQGFLLRALTTHRVAREGRGDHLIFHSTTSTAHEHSNIYLQLCTRDDYDIFLIATLVFTRLLLDGIYHQIELLFNWLMMWCWFLFVCSLNWF